MIFYLNDFVLNNPAARVYVDEDVEGLDLPAVRTSKGNRAGQHGGYIGAQFRDVRHITIPGRIFSSSVAEALQKRRAIQAALPLYPDVITLRITDDDGASYLLYCQYIDFKMPVKRFRGRSIFKLELDAVDPRIFIDTGGSGLTATITKTVPGGMLISSTTPQFGSSTYFTAGESVTTIDNPSLIDVQPVITITGKVTNPSIVNYTTGEVFTMTNYSVPAGSVTKIDMFNHTVTLNGSNVFAYVPRTSDWITLVPGLNQVELQSGSVGDVSEAVATWRPALWGI